VFNKIKQTLCTWANHWNLNAEDEAATKVLNEDNIKKGYKYIWSADYTG
jgi:hypothetical protein